MNEEPAVRQVVQVQYPSGLTHLPLHQDGEPYLLVEQGRGEAHRERLIPESKARKMARDARKQGRREGQEASRRPPAVGPMFSLAESFRGAYEAARTSNINFYDVRPLTAPTGLEVGIHPLRIDAAHGAGCTVVKVGHAGELAPQILASARCHPGDTDDPKVGLNLAASRAFFALAEHYFTLANQHATCHLRAPWAKKGIS